MSRIRTIKPDFFFDEHLAEMPYETRLTFVGLWCLADREGRLEDSPKKIKAHLFPYNGVDIEKCLDELSKKLVIRYVVNGKNYMQIRNFLKHQRPHHTEKASVIPPQNTVKQRPSRNNKEKSNGDSTVNTQSGDGEARVGREGKGKEGNGVMCITDARFLSVWLKYPKKLGKKEAQKHFNASVVSDQDLKDIDLALEKYIAYVAGKDAQYIQMGSTWFNNWRDWLDYDGPVDQKAKFAEIMRLNKGGA